MWLYRYLLAQARVIATFFEAFDRYLEPPCYLAMGGQIIDAAILPAAQTAQQR